MNRLIGALVPFVVCAALPAGALGAESWLAPQPLSEPGTSNLDARIATNSPGVAALVWNEFKGDRTPRDQVRAAVRDPDGPWSPSERISGDGDAGSPAVGVDPQGPDHRRVGGGQRGHVGRQGPRRAVNEGQAIPGAAGGKPDIFVASDGTATVVWFTTTPGSFQIKTARRELGGAWSSVETISPVGGVRPHVSGDIAGNVTVSFTLNTGSPSQAVYAVDRPNSGPWGTPTPLAGGLADGISDLVVAPNSGAATVFWRNGGITAPLAARTRVLGGSWATSATVPVSGDTAGRLDFAELDRAAVDGTGLVTAAWIAGSKC